MGGAWREGLQGPWSQGKALDAEKDPEHIHPWGSHRSVVVTPRQLARGIDSLKTTGAPPRAAGPEGEGARLGWHLWGPRDQPLGGTGQRPQKGPNHMPKMVAFVSVSPSGPGTRLDNDHGIEGTFLTLKPHGQHRTGHVKGGALPPRAEAGDANTSHQPHFMPNWRC